MLEPEFVLKSMPPRLARSALERERFVALWDEVRDRTAIAVIATAGFGKTTLLSQWRLLWLKQGAYVAWLTADGQDEPARFAQGLMHALRAATGKASFEAFAGRGALRAGQAVEAVTALLAEIAQLGSETVLVIDDAERLPEASARELLAYLVHNAPPNLHVVVGSRQPLPVATAELAAKGKLAVIRTEDMRLRQEESIAILQRRLGNRIDLDACVRLHDACEGWPIGLQLAAATVERSEDPAAAIASLSGRHGDLGDYFMQSLFSHLPDRLAEFLVRVSILERLSPELAEALMKDGDAAQCLERISQETPIVVSGEQQWLRLHPMARDFLLARFERLPAEERDVYHCRAYHWFARRDRYHEAASHALAAGDLPATHSHAARALWTLGMQGRLAQAEVWLERIPAEVVAQDPELSLIAAWILIFGERHAEAMATAQAVLADPASPPRLLLMASRVAAGAAAYADRLGLIPHFVSSVPEPGSGIDDPVHSLAYQNPRALLALHAGRCAEVRARAAALPDDASTASLPIASAVARMLVGLSYLWDGNLAQVQATLQAALLEAERDTGRRGAVACLYAPVLAAAARDGGDPELALALLADRLDAIERSGPPDAVMLAYLTLARVALDRDDERRALNVLENLCEYAQRRDLPRLLLHGLVERLRVHSRQQRLESVRALLARIEDLDVRFAQPDLEPFRQQYDLLLALARSQAALARDDLAVAARSLVAADAIANMLGRHRYQLQAKALRAVLAHRQGDGSALAMAREAYELAELDGYHRLPADAPKQFAELIAGPRVADSAAPPLPVPPRERAAARVAAGGGLLTPKEARILELLDQGMSNKLIARAMDISDETVKWHLKNLFAKLSAGTRKHAVGRARLLGLIAS